MKIEKASIGCNTLYPDGRLESEESFTLPRQLRALDTIAEAGFHGVEYSHTAPLAIDELHRIAEHARSLGLVSWSIHSWTPLAGQASEINGTIQRFRIAADIAKALGVHIIVVHSAGSIELSAVEERRRANTETLSALAVMAGTGITVAVENTGPRADWEFVIDVVSRCPVENVGLNIDTGHACISDMGVGEAIRMANGFLRTTHLHDNHGRRDDHLPPGTGVINWRDVLDSLSAVEYHGMFMVEITDRPAGREPDPAGDTRMAAQNLRSLLSDGGIEVA